MGLEYRVVDSIGVGPPTESREEAELMAKEWMALPKLKKVRIEQREIGPWREAAIGPTSDGGGAALEQEGDA